MMPCEITDYAGFYNGNWWIHKSYFYGPASLVTSDPTACASGTPAGGTWFYAGVSGLGSFNG